MLIKTRSETRALVLRRGRIVDHLNSHPTADVNTDLDNGYRDLRALATNSRWSTFLVTTGVLPLPTTAPVATETFVEIPVPTGAQQLRRLETLSSDGQVWLPAENVGFEQMRGAQRLHSSFQTYGPFRWCELDDGTRATQSANTGSLVAGRVALAPVPTQGSYQLWYLPEFATTSADSGANGFYSYATEDMFEYHVWHVVANLLAYDNDAQGTYKAARDREEEYKLRITNSAPTAAGPRTMRRARQYRS